MITYIDLLKLEKGFGPVVYQIFQNGLKKVLKNDCNYYAHLPASNILPNVAMKNKKMK